ncbi:UNKNOWN [Stylonychia lemnae]|uniref:MaoC-like domain-containing protein n=1 Tax=Stylonychia lemnae TaxID=5949 RepID=A0A078AY49_STYLE|nr:UNKNOWN [Stylonychia lemnae]|eukprot:CDW87046.1 UNKNOWN [Stylonychia lemnae]
MIKLVNRYHFLNSRINPNIFSQRYFGVLIREPLNPATITEMKVKIGDYAMQERIFDKEDLKKFSEAIQDKYAAHLNHGENSHTFYRSDIIYGIFTSAMFTSIFRSHFPKCIYMDQNLQFKKPILQDEKVIGKVEIISWDAAKKNVTFKTTISNIDQKTGKEQVAVDGTAILKVPYITVE